MRETRLSGSEGGGAVAGSPYPYHYVGPYGPRLTRHGTALTNRSNLVHHSVSSSWYGFVDPDLITALSVRADLYPYHRLDNRG